MGLVLATGIATYFHLDVPTIGSIPQSLPMPQGIPHWNDFSVIRELINPALALAALGSIESLLSAVVADGMTVSEKHNSDRELIGQGLANIIIPFLVVFPQQVRSPNCCQCPFWRQNPTIWGNSRRCFSHYCFDFSTPSSTDSLSSTSWHSHGS